MMSKSSLIAVTIPAPLLMLMLPPDVNPPSDVIGSKLAAILFFPYSY
jgi:hypothetical protein